MIFPWPPPADESPTAGLARTWLESLFRPSRFFGAMPVPGSPMPAILYYLIVGIAGAAINLFWQSIFRMVAPGSAGSGPLALLLGLGQDAWSPILGFLLSPMFLLVQLLVGAAIAHAFLWIFGGARRGFQTTLRVLCFAYGPILLLVFPFVGGFAALVWIIVLQITGLAAAHTTDRWRAALAVLAPAALILLSLFLAGLVAVLAVIGSA